MELVTKGIPSSSTQCLLLGAVPADSFQTLAEPLGRCGWGSHVPRLSADGRHSRITANVVAMSKATFGCFDSEDLCVFKICSRRKTFW